MEIFNRIKNQLIIYLINHTCLYPHTVWIMVDKTPMEELKDHLWIKEVLNKP